MKKLILLFLVFNLLTGFSLKAQTGVPDTLLYLKTIVQHKAHYIGQPFSKLLDSLQIQIKYFFPKAAIHHNSTKETSTSFSFFFPTTIDDLYLCFPMLDVTWLNPVNGDAIQSDMLRDQYDSVGWNSVIINNYSSRIIGDIKVRE
jgi:hypothetical protein